MSVLVQEHMYLSKNPLVGWVVQFRVSSILEQIRPGDRVLDAGCCEGFVALEMSKKVGSRGRVLCVDVDKGYLASARRNAKRAGAKNVDFLQSDLASFRTLRKFDKIVCSEVLEHVARPEKIVSALSNCLKPGGRLIVTIPNEIVLRVGRRLVFGSHARQLEKTTDHKSVLDAGVVVGMARYSGLEPVLVREIPFPLVFLNQLLVFRKTG